MRTKDRINSCDKLAHYHQILFLIALYFQRASTESLAISTESFNLLVYLEMIFYFFLLAPLQSL